MARRSPKVARRCRRPRPCHHTPSYTVRAAWHTSPPAMLRRRILPFYRATAGRPRRRRLGSSRRGFLPPSRSPHTRLALRRLFVPEVAGSQHRTRASQPSRGAPCLRSVRCAAQSRTRLSSLPCPALAGLRHPPRLPRALRWKVHPLHRPRPRNPSLSRPWHPRLGPGPQLCPRRWPQLARFPRRAHPAQRQSRLRLARRLCTRRWWSPIVQPQRLRR